MKLDTVYYIFQHQNYIIIKHYSNARRSRDPRGLFIEYGCIIYILRPRVYRPHNGYTITCAIHFLFIIKPNSRYRILFKKRTTLRKISNTIFYRYLCVMSGNVVIPNGVFQVSIYVGVFCLFFIVVVAYCNIRLQLIFYAYTDEQTLTHEFIDIMVSQTMYEYGIIILVCIISFLVGVGGH